MTYFKESAGFPYSSNSSANSSANSFQSAQTTQITRKPPRGTDGGSSHKAKRPSSLVLTNGNHDALTAGGIPTVFQRTQDMNGVSVYFSPVAESFPYRSSNVRETIYGINGSSPLDPRYNHRLLHCRSSRRLPQDTRGSPLRESLLTSRTTVPTHGGVLLASPSGSRLLRNGSLGGAAAMGLAPPSANDQEIFSLHKYHSPLRRTQTIRRKIHTLLFRVKRRLAHWRVVVRRQVFGQLRSSLSFVRNATLALSRSLSSIRVPRMRPALRPKATAAPSGLDKPISTLHQFRSPTNLTLVSDTTVQTPTLSQARLSHTRTSQYASTQNNHYRKNIASFKNSSAYFDTFNEAEATQAQYRHRVTTPLAETVPRSPSPLEVDQCPVSDPTLKFHRLWRAYLLHTISNRIQMRKELAVCFATDGDVLRSPLVDKIRRSYIDDSEEDSSADSWGEADYLDGETHSRATLISSGTEGEQTVQSPVVPSNANLRSFVESAALEVKNEPLETLGTLKEAQPLELEEAALGSSEESGSPGATPHGLQGFDELMEELLMFQNAVTPEPESAPCIPMEAPSEVTPYSSKPVKKEEAESEVGVPIRPTETEWERKDEEFRKRFIKPNPLSDGTLPFASSKVSIAASAYSENKFVGNYLADESVSLIQKSRSSYQTTVQGRHGALPLRLRLTKSEHKKDLFAHLSAESS